MSPKLEKRFSAAKPLAQAEAFIQSLDTPVIGAPAMSDPTEEGSDIYYPEAIQDMDKVSLERLVWAFSAHKAYLEYQVGILKAKTKAIDSSIDALMHLETSNLLEQCKVENRKAPARDAMKSEIIGNSEGIIRKLEEQIKTQAELNRIESLYNGYSHLYDGVSRVITVRRDLT
tara:strand:+ start:7286 stop:7804 length:519 start_codon:yes stop_codon:yes gene_type:complete